MMVGGKERGKRGELEKLRGLRRMLFRKQGNMRKDTYSSKRTKRGGVKNFWRMSTRTESAA